MKDRDLLRLWAILRPLPRRMWFLRQLIRLQAVTATGSKSFPTIRMQTCAACVTSGRAPRGFCHAVTTRSVRNVSRICLKGSARCAARLLCRSCRALRLPRRLPRRSCAAGTAGCGCSCAGRRGRSGCQHLSSIACAPCRLNWTYGAYDFVDARLNWEPYGRI